jgi:hypothetical protein
MVTATSKSASPSMSRKPWARSKMARMRARRGAMTWA